MRCELGKNIKSFLQELVPYSHAKVILPFWEDDWQEHRHHEHHHKDNCCHDKFNQAPIVEAAKTISVNEDADPVPLNIVAPSDPDGDSLIIKVTAIPDNGSINVGDVVINVGDILSIEQLTSLQFSPGELEGNSSFSYNIDDGHCHVVGQVVTLEVLEADTISLDFVQIVERAESAEISYAASHTDASDHLFLQINNGGIITTTDTLSGTITVLAGNTLTIEAISEDDITHAQTSVSISAMVSEPVANLVFQEGTDLYIDTLNQTGTAVVSETVVHNVVGELVGIEDINADGNPELIFENAISTGLYNINVYSLDGAGNFTAFASGTFVGPGGVVDTALLNGVVELAGQYGQNIFAEDLPGNNFEEYSIVAGNNLVANFADGNHLDFVLQSGTKISVYDPSQNSIVTGVADYDGIAVGDATIAEDHVLLFKDTGTDQIGYAVINTDGSLGSQTYIDITHSGLVGAFSAHVDVVI